MYFKFKTFYLLLRNILFGEYTITRISSDKQPLRYTIASSKGLVGILRYKEESGELLVEVDYCNTVSSDTISEINTAIEKAIDQLKRV